MINLNASLQPLKEHFNKNRDMPRFVTLLSPTWPMWYEKGTRAVRAAISERFPDANISMSVIWLPIMETDGEAAAAQVVSMIPDARAVHFWDPQKLAGKAFGKCVGFEGRVAWDFYLFYPPGVEWDDEPCEPAAWMYQPSDDWTEAEHMRQGETLIQELVNGMNRVLQAEAVGL
jgi:hypothetical protein